MFLAPLDLFFSDVAMFPDLSSKMFLLLIESMAKTMKTRLNL